MNIGAFGPTPALSAESLSGIMGRAAIERLRAIGYAAIGIPAWRKDFDPEALGTSGARDLAGYLGRFSLAVSWLSAGRKGRFAVSASVDEDVERVRAVFALAAKLRLPGAPAIAVTASVGALGGKDSAPAASATDALRSLASDADASGAALALSPSEGEDALLDGIIASLGDAPVGRLLDPGMLLFAGRDPVDAVTTARRIVAVRASDSSADQTNIAPGEGRVPWRDLLAALGARDYHGYATVEFAPRGNDGERAAKALNVLRQSFVS